MLVYEPSIVGFKQDGMRSCVHYCMYCKRVRVSYSTVQYSIVQYCTGVTVQVLNSKVTRDPVRIVLAVTSYSNDYGLVYCKLHYHPAASFSATE